MISFSLRWLRHRACATAHALACLVPGTVVLAWSVTHGSLPKLLGIVLTITVAVYVGLIFPMIRRDRWVRQLAWQGYLAGLSATAVYTVFRWPAVALGLIPDLSLILGDQLLGVQNLYWERNEWSVVAGYVFHLLLTGAAWGSAFAVLEFWKYPWGGIAWGLAVGCIYLASPLFEETLTYQVMHIAQWQVGMIILLSHVPYGWTLGRAMRMVQRESLPSVRAGSRPPSYVSSSSDVERNIEELSPTA